MSEKRPRPRPLPQTSLNWVQLQDNGKGSLCAMAFTSSSESCTWASSRPARVSSARRSTAPSATLWRRLLRRAVASNTTIHNLTMSAGNWCLTAVKWYSAGRLDIVLSQTLHVNVASSTPTPTNRNSSSEIFSGNFLHLLQVCSFYMIAGIASEKGTVQVGEVSLILKATENTSRTPTKTQLNLTAHVSRLVVAADSSQNMFGLLQKIHRLFSVVSSTGVAFRSRFVCSRQFVVS